MPYERICRKSLRQYLSQVIDNIDALQTKLSQRFASDIVWDKYSRLSKKGLTVYFFLELFPARKPLIDTHRLLIYKKIPPRKSYFILTVYLIFYQRVSFWLFYLPRGSKYLI